MACRRVRTKPLSEAMLVYYQLSRWEQNAMIFESKYKIRSEENEFENVVCKMAAILSWPQCAFYT